MRLLIFALFLLACNPVKKVLNDPKKFEENVYKYIIEYNKKNTIHIKSLECFHEDGTLLMTMGKTE